MACVPLIALTHGLWAAGLLYNGERFGKALRSPSRDTMLAHASAKMGRGYAFGLHKALDQCGALTGPLLIAAVLAIGGSYRLGFAVLAVPALVALVVLVRLRAAAPDPTAYDPDAQIAEKKRLRLERRLPARFWLYAAFSAATMLGFSTWAVLAYHLIAANVVRAAWVPVLYSGAMGAAGIAAFAFGRLYDWIGLRGLIVLPPLAAVVPFLSFSTTLLPVTAGAIVWGTAMGIHESTLRAAVTDLVPAHRRGAGYGNFTAIYGLAWLIGAATIGVLYEHGTGSVQIFVAVTQILALALLIPLLRHTFRQHEGPAHAAS